MQNAKNARFTEANQAFVGTRYGMRTLPRALFLSLDSGESDTDLEYRTMTEFRYREEVKAVVARCPRISTGIKRMSLHDINERVKPLSR